MAVTVSTGDSGYGVQFPASSPHVIAVGGTHLVRATNARGWTETAWSGGGSGCSTVYAKPSFQTDAAVHQAHGSRRFGGRRSQHRRRGLRPDQPARVRLAGVRRDQRLGSADRRHLRRHRPHADRRGDSIYANAGSLNDVTSGTNGSCGGTYFCTAGAGYDGPTGNGTPNGTGAF